MRKYFFTVDFEDWYHLPYLSKYNFEREEYPSYANQIIPFMQYLKNHGIYATVFVVADIAQKQANIIKQISEMGHEIGCHSYSHEVLNHMNQDDFENETRKSKDIIEKIINKKIYGYRAPCFSMTESKLKILQKLGFKYDSSYIKSNANEYYNVMDLSLYNHIESLVYEKNGFYEIEIPTLKHGKKQIPIAGGGFFRLYPLWLYNLFLKNFFKHNTNFVFFIHPYEIAGTRFRGMNKILHMKDKIRIQLGRKNVLKKVKKNLNNKAFNNFNFLTFSEYIDSKLNNTDILLK